MPVFKSSPVNESRLTPFDIQTVCDFVKSLVWKNPSYIFKVSTGFPFSYTIVPILSQAPSSGPFTTSDCVQEIIKLKKTMVINLYFISIDLRLFDNIQKDQYSN